MTKSNDKQIKAIVFDYGGVIELYKGRNTIIKISELLNVPVDDLRAVYFQNNHISNVENMLWEDMIVKVVSVFTDDQSLKDQARAIAVDAQISRELNNDLLSLFPLFKQQGLKIGILSNSDSSLRKRLEDNGVAKLVDAIAISGEIGFQKPNPKAFQNIFEKLQVEPNKVIFVDDAKKSLETAEQIGYVPILFRGNDQLKIDLREIGVLSDSSI